MDVLNKFYSTVSSTVSQLSSVLPGNPLTREYEVTSQIASAGPGLLWKVYSGYKKSTKQEASIFVFEKRQVVPQDRELVVETLRRGVTQLTKLRHPQVLVVQHPLEESRDCLAFAAEPVFASLANILGRTDNVPSPNHHLTNYSLYDVEIKYGLLQVGEGLAFLHKDAKILHHNICPASIIVNQQGAWKIFGFDFSSVNTSSDSSQPKWSYVDYRKSGNELCQPELDFLAPECGLSETQVPASDMYSLGVLICTVFNKGQPVLPHASDSFTYTSNMSKLKTITAGKLSFVAEGLRELVRMMLNSTPELRPDEHEFIKASYFEDVGVKALNYLDSLFQWDNRQKAQFYKGLPQIIDKLPHRVCLHRVVPCLVKEFVNPMMVPFVLPNVFIISENCTKQEFSCYVLPHLKPVMTLQEPIQILLIFMQRMDLLLKMTTPDEVKNDVLPLLYRALESEAPEIQELCLSILPSSAGLIEYPAMKNALLPRIKRLCISTSSLSVRVNCLICIGKLLDSLDKWLVLDDVLPFLPQIPSREPAVLMGILGIYKMVLNHKKMNMSKELMAGKIVPFLMPLCIENTLSLNQFNALIAVVKDMVSRIETEHRAKLEQLHAIHQEQQNFESNLSGQAGSSPAVSQAGPSIHELEELFGIQSKPASSPLEPALSLSDKKRMIAEGDAAKRLLGMSLNPSAAAPTKPPEVQAKDLTANLIGKNMMSLSQGGGKMTLGKPNAGAVVNKATNRASDPPEWNWGTTSGGLPQSQAFNSSNPGVAQNQGFVPVTGQNQAFRNTAQHQGFTCVTNQNQAFRSATQNQGFNGWPPWDQTPAPAKPSTKPLSPSEINDFLS